MPDSIAFARLVDELIRRHAALKAALEHQEYVIGLELAVRDLDSVVDLLGRALGEDEWKTFLDEVAS